MSDEFRIKNKIKDKCSSVTMDSMKGIYYECNSFLIELDGVFDWVELKAIAKVLHDEVNNGM